MSLENIAQTLRLKRSGRDWIGACPSCGYRAGFSVTERDGRLLCYCAVGGCDWPSISAALVKRGLVDNRRELKRSRRLPARIILPPPAPPKSEVDISSLNNWQAAARIWRGSVPAAGTLVEEYLRSRGIVGPLPDVLRYATDLWHRESGTRGPGMVALVEHHVLGHVAIHRTWLREDGSGKADLDPNKMTLAPIEGAAIRLAPIGPYGDLAIAEGIETALSFMLLTGAPTWSAISANGIETLVLPPEVKFVGIAADPDPVGLRAAHIAARRWAAEGRRVRIAQPPLGMDFNDVLLARRTAP
jgi:putative DNA primase/helicase